MNNVTTKLVTPERLKQLLDCYGSTSSSWPEDERQAALSLLTRSPELNTCRDQAQSLDTLFKQIQTQESNALDQHAVQSLQQRIMNQLPEQDSSASNDDAPHNKSTNESDASHAGHAHHSHRTKVWVGSLAASLFVVSLSAGVIHQLFNSEHDAASQHVSNLASNEYSNDFAQWAWDDITSESLAMDTDNEPTTLLALVELELPVE